MDYAQSPLEAALAQVEANAPTDWKNAAAAVLARLAATGEPFSTDDIWAALEQPPEPRAIGALIRAAAQAGKIRRVGWRTSSRPECHSRPVAMWAGR
jgi:hypothetical protein